MAARRGAGRRRRNSRNERRPAAALQGLVRAVAEGLIARALAAAQPELLGFGDREFHRREFGSLVGPVAERLAFRAPAAAPPVVAGCELDRIGGLLREMGFGHDLSLLWGRLGRRPGREYSTLEQAFRKS